MIARRPPPPLPVTILTGFLGAGKTSLLNRLTQDPALADALVMINEFGEIGLDHLLVERIDGDMTLLSSGCLCCTMRGDLIAALEDLLRKRDNGRIRAFDRVVIETTGLADPAPILQALMGHPYLALRFRLDGIVTVVDAVHGVASLERHEEARRQAAVADRIVLSKADLPEAAAAIPALAARLGGLNPGAPRFASATVRASDLLDAGLFQPGSKIPDVAGWLRDEALRDHGLHGHGHGPGAPAHDGDGHASHDPASHDHGRHGHGHDHGGAHDRVHEHDHVHAHDHGHVHDPNRHDASIHAFAIRRATPLDPAGLKLFLELLTAAQGPKILRLKGIVALADDRERPLVVHGVRHLLHPPARLERWPDEDRTSRLVFIVDGLPRSTVEALFAAALNEPAPDTPDRAALTQAPLSPRPGGLLA